MTRAARGPALWAAGGLALLLGGLQAGDAPPRLGSGATLHAAAGGGAPTGFLGAATPVRVLEERDGWVRVQAEGWIPASALAAAAAGEPGATGGATPTEAATGEARKAGGSGPAPAVPAAPTALLEGSLTLAGRRGRVVLPADVQVLLLPADAGSQMAPDGQEATRLADLEDQAADLERRAERAMAQPSFTQAVQEHDRLMDEREQVLARRDEIVRARHGRHEALARSAALAATRADARGWYTFSGVAPGTYTLYARLVDGERDVQWMATVAVVPGRTRRDLGPEEAQGTDAP